MKNILVKMWKKEYVGYITIKQKQTRETKEMTRVKINQLVS